MFEPRTGTSYSPGSPALPLHAIRSPWPEWPLRPLRFGVHDSLGLQVWADPCPVATLRTAPLSIPGGAGLSGQFCFAESASPTRFLPDGDQGLQSLIGLIPAPEALRSHPPASPGPLLKCFHLKPKKAPGSQAQRSLADRAWAWIQNVFWTRLDPESQISTLQSRFEYSEWA